MTSCVFVDADHSIGADKLTRQSNTTHNNYINTRYSIFPTLHTPEPPGPNCPEPGKPSDSLPAHREDYYYV